MDSPSSELDDAAYAALALAGDQRGYRGLLARHRASVFRLVRTMTGNDEDAKDLTQQAFISAFDALARYDPSLPFRNWIARIAINKCRDWGRRRTLQRWFSGSNVQDIEAVVADDHPDAHRIASGKSELDKVSRAIAQLPTRLREVLVLRGVEEMSEAETAKLLGISGKAVETRLYRARNMLREMLEDNRGRGVRGGTAYHRQPPS